MSKPRPTNLLVCTACKLPWAKHTALAESWGLEKVTKSICVFLLTHQHDGIPGPPGPVGAIGMSGSTSVSWEKITGKPDWIERVGDPVRAKESGRVDQVLSTSGGAGGAAPIRAGEHIDKGDPVGLTYEGLLVKQKYAEQPSTIRDAEGHTVHDSPPKETGSIPFPSAGGTSYIEWPTDKSGKSLHPFLPDPVYQLRCNTCKLSNIDGNHPSVKYISRWSRHQGPAPTDPEPGDAWLDGATLKFWTGTKWVSGDDS